MKRRTKRRSLATPDLTPLIDVVFLLLIFFMLVTTFDKYSGFKLDLPTVGVEADSPKNVYELIIDSDKKYYLKVDKKSEEITLEDIPVKFAYAKEVTVTADKGLTYEVVVKSIGALKDAGIDKVELNFYE
nr:biopolymer transporter ExbD [uncultured Cetobacterium sp.]